MPEKKSTYTSSQKKAIYKHSKKLDHIHITVPKGRREVYKDEADRRGLSLNSFVVSTIEKEIEASTEDSHAAEPEKDQLSQD